MVGTLRDAANPFCIDSVHFRQKINILYQETIFIQMDGWECSIIMVQAKLCVFFFRRVYAITSMLGFLQGRNRHVSSALAE